MDYPRYKPRRPAGSSAFFDYVAGVSLREVRALKSCRIDRRAGRRPSENPFQRQEKAEPVTD